MLVSAQSVPSTPRPPTSPRVGAAAPRRPHTTQPGKRPAVDKVDLGVPSHSSPIYFRKAIAPRMLEQRVFALVRQLSEEEGAREAATEIALLVSHTLSAIAVVARLRIEQQLALLLEHPDDTLRHVCLCILSNISAVRESLQRQAFAVTPVLCALIKRTDLSSSTLHAATLHLAALTQSVATQRVIASDYSALRRLDEIEEMDTYWNRKKYVAAGLGSITHETSRYARWALRTAKGRRRKPLFVQADIDEAARIAHEAALARARKVREETERYIRSRANSMTSKMLQSVADAAAARAAAAEEARRRAKEEKEQAASRIQARQRGKRSRRDLEDREEARRRFEAELAARKQRILEEEEAIHLFESSEVAVGGSTSAGSLVPAAAEDGQEAQMGEEGEGEGGGGGGGGGGYVRDAVDKTSVDGSSSLSATRAVAMGNVEEEEEEDAVAKGKAREKGVGSGRTAVVENAFDVGAPLAPVETD